ncbi:PAS domain-containing protein [Arenibaculum pallidiluteum]|uniref:PAS domain-containing protein n=1 Tax=Arenibaculum pallidiluteum TaxID=2812559 RepID=UPI001A95F17D|nr:PAS domain-containing protein [Arenibaculum pallidiluteum]
MNLISRLLVLVCIAIAPAVAIQAYNVLKLRKDLEAEVHRNTAQFAADAAAEIDTVVHSTRLLLGSIAASPAVVQGNAEECTAHVAAIERRFPEYTRIGVVDADGNVTCYSQARHLKVDLESRAYLREALQRDTFTVGLLTRGAASGRHSLPMALPVQGGQGRPRLVFAALDLGWLSERLAGRSIPDGGSITVADRAGTIIARNPMPERFIGTRIPDAYLHLLEAAEPGTVEVQSQDGTSRLLGYVPPARNGSGLYVSAGLSTRAAFSAIDAASRSGLLLVAFGSAVALAAALVGGYAFIRRPVNGLLATTRRWRDGDLAARVPTSGLGGEIDHLAHAFNEMADAVRRRDEALRANERRLLQRERDFSDLLVASSPDGILGYDPSFRVTTWSPAAERMIGLPQEAVVGRSFFALFPSARGTALEAAMRAALAGESREIPGMPYPAETGRQGSIEMQHFPLRDNSGTVVGGIAFIRDATERERLESRLREAQKLEAVGRLTGGIAHDFNNLLQALSGCLRLVRRKSSEPALEPLVETGLQTVERGAKLTQQLLAFARRQDLRPEAVDLRKRILGMSDLLARALREDIRLEIDAEEGLWPVDIDATQFELAILNLAVNARDAMPRGGELRIRARNVTGSEIRTEFAGVEPAGHFVRISVSDSGEGMPPEVLARAFEPFFTTKDVGRGSGLGLSQVYGFVRQSGGQIRIASRPGDGTDVLLMLPRSGGQPVAAEAVERPEQVASGARILLVEDDPAVAAMLAEGLADLGYEVSQAPGPKEALALLSGTGRIDLLLSDIVMPGGMNGVELARTARRIRPGIRVLLATGYSEGIAVGGEFRIIPKPFRIEALQDAIERELQPAPAADARAD